MPIDDKVLVVTYSGNDEHPDAKVKSVVGEYVRTEPGCYRKEGGGKVHFLGGYWYIVDRLGQQVAWVEGGSKTIPEADWQTRGSGIFQSWEDIPISVANKVIEASVRTGAKGPVGCSNACSQMWNEMKEKLPEEHKETLATYEAKALEHHAGAKARLGVHYATAQELHDKHLSAYTGKAMEHTATFREKYNEVAPVVKQKCGEGYSACYEWWTHPATVEAIKKAGDATLNALKFCLAGCLTMTASLLDQAAGNSPQETRPTPALSVIENEQAMDASYVKLDSASPVLVEFESNNASSHRAMFQGDQPAATPPSEDSPAATPI